MFHKLPIRANLIWQLGFIGAALGWMVFIFYAPSLSNEEASKFLESGAVSWLGDIRSYMAHAVLFGVLAALMLVSFWSWKFGYQLRWAVLASLAATLYGVSDDIHQSFLAGRSATLGDIFVNLAGSIFAAAGLWLLAKALRYGGKPRQGLGR